MHQIWISYFSRHFYEVNLILVLTQIHWMSFDERKNSFIFHDSNFKAMTFSVRSEADQNISNSLYVQEGRTCHYLNKLWYSHSPILFELACTKKSLAIANK